MMEWTEEAIVIGARTHGETSVIAELLTRERGRWLGLVHGGRSRRMRPLLQPGNRVEATWRARLDEHLGRYTLEPTAMRAAALMQSPIGIYGVQTLATHLTLLPERDAHARLYDMADVLVDRLHDPREAGEGMVRFELALLDELGFGLDLASCAATGVTDDLVYVSPRSGRAVSREGGEGYEDRLLALPPFLADPQRHGPPGADSIEAGLRLTGTFLERAAQTIRDGAREALPIERDAFRRAVVKALH